MSNIDLDKVQSNIQGDMDAVVAWCNEIYDTQFSSYFEEERELYGRLKCKDRPITDEELSQILTIAPLNLFSVAEHLNKLRLRQEVIKLKNKQKKADIIKMSLEKTDTKKSAEANLLTLEDELLSTAYSSIITRVENEISFTRELIMSAKKLWDARRRTESVNPVSEVNAPEDGSTPYNVYRPSTYIK